MEIEPRECAGGNADAVMRAPGRETVADTTAWSEGHAPRPKHVADQPSAVWSHDRLVQGPQTQRGDRSAWLPVAVWLLVRRDLGVLNRCDACEQQVGAATIGVLVR